MIELMLADAALRVQGKLEGEDVAFRGVTIDSRNVRAGMLFAALPGERVDGHDYISTALEAGAVAAMVSKPVEHAAPVIRVEDVTGALGALAKSWREVINPVVIGITGSNGKTTTKEMVREILRRQRTVLATKGNYNNELGVPLTLFGLSRDDDIAVIEMGAGKAGDIRYLADIAQPDIGLVTNVGPAHLEGFGDEAGVARAKGEMFESLPDDGWAIMNADQPWIELWRGMSSACQSLSFGRSAGCDVRLEQEAERFFVHTPEGSFPLALALPGGHNQENALAATAVALAAGIGLEQIQAGLEAVSPVSGRLQIRQAADGWKVIDDTYNANPASLYAALQVLANEGGEPWLVLGDMAELGSHSHKLHAEMGDAARSLGVRRLYAMGDASRAAVEAFGDGATHFSHLADLLERLLSELNKNVTCLVKGSRSMGMERVVEAISRRDVAREAG